MTEQFVEDASLTNTAPKKFSGLIKLMLLLVVVCAGVAAGMFAFNRYKDTSRQRPERVVIDGEEYVLAPTETATFSDVSNALAIEIGECSPDKVVPLSQGSQLRFTGVTKIKDVPFCNMELLVQSQSESAAYTCSYKIDPNQPTIYLKNNFAGADREFLSRHCKVIQIHVPTKPAQNSSELPNQ